MWPDQAVARENVRRLLFEQAMTAKSLAEQTGIASSTIYNWLRDSAPEDWREQIREIERYVRSIEDPVERLVDQYNKIVAACEKDPSLRVAMDDST